MCVPSVAARIEAQLSRNKYDRSVREQTRRTDVLTGLGNREMLIERLMGRSGDGAALAVLLLDLDGFKIVNDSCGIAVGDKILIEVAARLREVVDRLGPGASRSPAWVATNSPS